MPVTAARDPGPSHGAVRAPPQPPALRLGLRAADIQRKRPRGPRMLVLVAPSSTPLAHGPFGTAAARWDSVFWRLGMGGRNLGGLVGRLSSTGKHRCSTNPRTGPRTWQDAQRTARLGPGRRQQQGLFKAHERHTGTWQDAQRTARLEPGRWQQQKDCWSGPDPLICTANCL